MLLLRNHGRLSRSTVRRVPATPIRCVGHRRTEWRCPAFDHGLNLRYWSRARRVKRITAASDPDAPVVAVHEIDHDTDACPGHAVTTVGSGTELV